LVKELKTEPWRLTIFKEEGAFKVLVQRRASVSDDALPLNFMTIKLGELTRRLLAVFSELRIGMCTWGMRG
jgi:hypothetical protein